MATSAASSSSNNAAGASARLVEATVAFLQAHPPFDSIDPAALRAFAAQAKLGYYAAGTTIVAPQSGVVTTLYLVEKGLVHARTQNVTGAMAERLEFGVGEAFPIAAVIGKRATTLEYVATRDTFAYEVPAAAAEALSRASHEFERFCTRHVDRLLQRATERLQQAFATSSRSDQPMVRSLGSLSRRAPVTCSPDISIREAVKIMAAQSVGAIVIADAAQRPLGIFTERDLLRLVADHPETMNAPIGSVAIRKVVALPASALAMDAAVAMVENGIRHVVVRDGERLAGVVSERDLFALQRHTMSEVARRIEAAGDIDALVRAAEDVRGLIDNLLAQGVGAESLTALISALNDRLTRRVLAYAARDGAVDGIDYCWLALGSEGREEQTMATDQDNAIVFRCDDVAQLEPMRSRLLAFAREANTVLDRCGFPLCKGNVMASNAELCLTEGEWRKRFDDWMRHPTPEALLSSTIMFDFRALGGDASLAHSLRSVVNAQAPGAKLFLRLLAEEAMRTPAPIGWLGSLRTEAQADGADTLDLKLQGTRLFVDVARLYALAHGVEATNTAARLRQVAARLRVSSEDVEASIDAFEFIQLLRLRQQRANGSNRIDPDSLNELERRILKESLRRAQTLQQRVALDYRL